MRVFSRLFAVVLLGCVGVFLPLSAHAQSGRAPQVGQPAPAFTLPDLNGKSVSLDGYRGKKNVLLVFYRGWIGYW